MGGGGGHNLEPIVWTLIYVSGITDYIRNISAKFISGQISKMSVHVLVY